ncbi:MAG: hypothetical protein QOE71_342 [Pseudonocardiales bacterium]|jgi:hypothetical protein|nr:hypothetical protein [Pseudonocardiales bacterium]MDQ1749286.1 hypothetical protein [Pseudonocardiales bacterium]
MPVITVLGPPLSPAEVNLALKAVNAAAARALNLPTDAVHSMFLPATAGATGTKTEPAWPAALLHGPAGDAAEMAAASTAVAAVLGGVWGQPVEHTWVHWVITG